jgi:hypothetical protein
MASGTLADPADVPSSCGKSVDVTERVGMKHSNHLLHVGCRTSPRRRVSAGCAPSGFSTPTVRALGVSALRPGLRR